MWVRNKLGAFFLIAVVLWTASDIILGLEYSWVLFLYRALAPVLVSVIVLILSLQLVIARIRNESGNQGRTIVWLILLGVAIAPILASLKFTSTYTLLPSADRPKFTVLNLNALGFMDLSATIVDEIERRDPDIVTIQEVNPSLAQAIEQRLSQRYQCRIQRPLEGSSGMSTLAKNPCTERNNKVTGTWVGRPIIIDTTTPSGSPIAIANFHALHPHAGLSKHYAEQLGRSQQNWWKRLSLPIFDREHAISKLLEELGSTASQNIIISGDLNASMRSRVYSAIREAGYSDAWLALHSVISGGTWPAPQFIGGLGIGWLLRIDFIFCSPSLLPTQMELLPADIGSDHRGMIGRFAEWR